MKTMLALGSVVFLTAGCGDDERPSAIDSGRGGANSGGSAGTTSSGGSSGTGGEGGDGTNAPGAPVVMVTSPEALDHPNDGDVIVADEVSVTCQVSKAADDGSQPVNPSTVIISALDAGGSVVAQAAGDPTSNASEYSASLIIASVPNGVVSFSCSASDTAEIPNVGTHTISTFVDHGPAINVKSPLPDSAHPLMGPLRFEFTVDPAPLADGDSGAAIDVVELDVNGIPVPATNMQDNLYEANVILNDPVVFPTTPSGAVPVVIRASNVRTPTPGESFESYAFAVDGSGPFVEITSHNDEKYIGGQTELKFTIKDELVGVDPESVVVRLNGVDHRYSATDGNWTVVGENYSFRIDSRNIDGSAAQITINIVAQDSVGNPSSGGSLTLYLDTFPPTIDLDPGNVRERIDSGTGLVCSESFDPLGLAENDLSNVANFILPRALVWDETNSGPDQQWLYFSGTDPDQVYLYLNDVTDEPLVVDTDGDGVCDDVDRTQVGLPFQRLKPVNPMGVSGSDDGSAEPVPVLPPAENPQCTLQASGEPPTLCDGESDLQRVINHGIAFGEEAVVYAKGSLENPECTGGQWEVTPHVKEGWICLAVVAFDIVGNRSVSAPLRLCYDNLLIAGTPACIADKDNAPSCTASCTPAPGFASKIINLN